MQRLKRIRKWNCPNENYNNNITRMTSSMLLPAAANTTTATTTTATTTKSFQHTSTITTAAAHLPKWEFLQEDKVLTSVEDNNNNNYYFKQINSSKTRKNLKSTNIGLSSKRNRHSRTKILQCLTKWTYSLNSHKWFIMCIAISITMQNFTAIATKNHEEEDRQSTQPMQPTNYNLTNRSSTTTTTAIPPHPDRNSNYNNDINNRTAPWQYFGSLSSKRNGSKNNVANDSIFLRFAKHFAAGNELWDGIIRDCYKRPTFSCFQKNVYIYLNDALDANDVNVTQQLKFFKNQVDYVNHEQTTEAAAALDNESVEENSAKEVEEELLENEIPHIGRAAADTPIEEVTNALYGKSIKFAMTHDIELKLPEMMFDGATFRISPRSIEGNGIIAKLELIPKQEVQARLAGKILMKKIQKFIRSKLLLSFLALLLIIKIIKIKLFWLLPIVIGVGAAKKLLLKFLLFLFPALSHLFKLCSYYQQTYHSTKYHHHHHHINHHHTVVPSWHGSGEHIPEIIYTSPPKGHPSAYLHGAPIHETYGPPKFEHFENWESSGPGLGSEYINDINRAAQLDGNSNFFKPHANDAGELHTWGLGTTQPTHNNKTPQSQRLPPASQQQRPPTTQKQTTLSLQQPQFYKKPQVTSHNFNPFLSPEKQSIFNMKYKNPSQAQSAPSPVYVPQRNQPPHQQPGPGGIATQIAAQYDPSRNNLQQQTQNQDITPEVSAQIKEALRVQTEQRIIQQQQKILENQPFVLDGGQPLMPKNYDPFYSPILLKIDKIIEQLGITDELCKERLVCSMYKDPQRYSPHSNFVSAELSRDTNELQPPTNTNEAVTRFYRLIQAARDGQDQQNCLILYPQCNINTE